MKKYVLNLVLLLNQKHKFVPFQVNKLGLYD